MAFNISVVSQTIFASMALVSGMVCASSLTVTVSDMAGVPLADVAVYAQPLSGVPAAKPNRRIDIEQQARKFIPLVTVVQTGAEISFPNNDSIRHHVYSFSAPKIFDIELYSGMPAKPIVFDKAGTVVIGCNIHDQMIAYIHIVNTPFFTKTDADGRARIDGLSAGKYQLKAWHYSMPLNAPAAEQAFNVTGADASAVFKLNVKPAVAAH